MNRLFLRIWLANWLVFVVVVFSSIFLFTLLREQEIQQRLIPPHIRAQQLIDKLQGAVAQGESPAKWALKVSNKRQTVYLLNPQGQDIAERALPDFVQQRLDTANGRNFAPKAAPPRRLRFHPVALPGEPPLRLLNIRHRSRWQLFYSAVMIGFAFLGSGAVAVLLARYITSPIKQLYLATERIAAGDFQSHVADSVGRRKDEIAALARRFDFMAKELDSATKNQQNLLRDVSHELRSPLARMQLIADMLKHSSDEGRGELQGRLSKELNELESLIDEVMTLTRFETEAVALSLEKTDIIAVLAPLIDDASFEADALNKSVLYVHHQAPLLVNLAATYFCRAVENLIRNAIRHTPENSEVRVELKAVKQQLVIVVSDCGEGVDQSELSKIFSPFYRSSTARARYKGAGIGLALAERIVKSHNGEISAKNKPSGGLEVSISLPLLDD
ncbi:MAG: HAMP domain-containing protein [Cellvibrionaceae bacterium]|nr:HAMP domain-containing protein [Cellvibrionaceae bacterium]